MPSPQRVTQPADLIDWRLTQDRVCDLTPEWRVPRPDVAGLRTAEEIELLRTYLLAGRPFRRDPAAPRVMTDRGQQIAARFPFAEPARAAVRRASSNGLLIVLVILGLLGALAVVAQAGLAATLIFLVLVLAFPITAKIAVDAIDNETLHPVLEVYRLRPDELAVVRSVRTAVGRITASRSYREGYLDQHRSLVDLSATADAITRRVVEISAVRTQVSYLTGPVRGHAEEAMSQVNASLATQIAALQSYSRHVGQLDQHLRDSDSNNIAAEGVFEAIRELLASTVEDELETPRLSDAAELTSATSTAITATVQEAAADLHRLLGADNPSLPELR